MQSALEFWQFIINSLSNLVAELFQNVSSNRNTTSGHKSAILTTGVLQPAVKGPRIRYMTCGICNKTYKTKYMNQHMAVHSKERPYDCTFQACGAKFKAASNLRRHLRIHTPQPSVTSQSNTPLSRPICKRETVPATVTPNRCLTWQPSPRQQVAQAQAAWFNSYLWDYNILLSNWTASSSSHHSSSSQQLGKKKSKS